jgi:class 3 adenylate cyclase/predicted ATPase
MDFYEVLEKVIELLQRHGRVTYPALKLQFKLDDDALDTLKKELIFAHPVVDEAGRGLVWTGEADLPSESDVRREADSEVRFHAILPVLTMLLQHEGQVTYRTLMQVFGLDDALRNDLRKELAFRGLAIDKDGEGLVWVGDTRATGTIELPDAISTDVPSAEPVDISEPTRTAPEAERRQLTVMFCDLADSTKLSQQLDPEDLREVVRAYQATAVEVIEQYAGHMAQYLGDGLLIYFGWPTAHEDDAQRSLHAGLGIVEAITTTLNPRLAQEKGVQLTVRIGVHTGPVVVGEIGGGGRHENLATGETVNLAARLEGLAPPNTMVISPTTARLVEGGFALEDLGTHVLKGVAEPMQVFRVLGHAERDRDKDESLSGGGVFLVGRDEEVGLLLRRWEQSKEGFGQVVLISGEAGIGKSSLVTTIRHHVVEEGHTRMTFRCSPYHTNSALYAVIEHLQRVLQFQPGDTPEVRLDKLEQVLENYGRPLEDVVPLYAALLSVPLPEGRYPAPNVTPQQQRQQIQDALLGWLLEEAERQPALAVWQDLHWADPSTLELLGLVLEQTPTVPMLHVLTYRPEFEMPWPSRSHMTPIVLSRLERPQVEALIAHLARDKTLPSEVVEHIVTKTDGVPLYVEELTKMLLDSDLLREEADHYVLTGPLSTVAIPDSLQASLMARLDRLQDAKEIAQVGAVLGREFAYDILRAISFQDEAVLQTALAQLVEAELLYQRGRPPRARYVFKHALIRDAAYASLLRSTRQHMHQRVAQLLEQQFPETVAAQPELVAHHYTEAGCSEQAIDYWQQAGRRAIGQSAPMEAVAHLRNGLALLETLPETVQRVQQELRLQTTLGPALMTVKGYAAPEVKQAYTRARELCRQAGDTSRLFSILLGLGTFYFASAELQTARDIGEESLRLALRRNDTWRCLQAYLMLGTATLMLGEFTLANECLTQGIVLDTTRPDRSRVPSGTTSPRVSCHHYASFVLWQLGYPVQARQRSDEGLRLAQALAHPVSIAGALIWSAMTYYLLGQVQVVQQRVGTVLTLATKQRFPYFIAIGTAARGLALAMQGQYDEGIAQTCQGVDVLQATGARVALSFFLSGLAEAYGQNGQPEDGLRTLATAFAHIDQTGERWFEAEIYRLKGILLLKRKSPDAVEAEACFHRSLDIARQQQAKSWELRAATSLARLWQSQGKRQDAYELLASVYGWFTEGFDTADLKDAKALLEELA